MFITLDGGDGCGKTTQLQRLHERLVADGREVVLCRDPGSTQLGMQIREILLHRALCRIDDISEMLLFMAARAQMVCEVIRPALDAGLTVLCDRFLLSTLVYQGCAGGVALDAIERVANVAIGDTLPDVGIVLDVPRTVALERMNRDARTPDRMESKDDAYQQRVRDGFLALAARDPKRYHIVDATPPANEVAKIIWDVIQS
ncbi:MAG: dTMP kinase [Thermoguttaceae bacterium]